MKTEIFLAVTTIICSLSEATNGRNFKRQMLPICDKETFERGKIIGSGVGGLVYDIKRKNDDKIFAIKEGFRNDFANEIEALSRINGLGIAPDILCAGSDQKYFIMEKVNGKTLKEASLYFLNNLDPKSSPTSIEKSKRLKLFQTVAIQMLSIMEEVHKANIYHGDAHWKNWMVEKETLKVFLIDFGFCKFMNTQNEATRKKNEYFDVVGAMTAMYRWAKNNLLLEVSDLPPILTQFLRFGGPKVEFTSIAEILAPFRAI